MTDLQRYMAEQIVMERKELEAKGKILDLLLKFWKEANNEFRYGNSHITRIRYKDSVWTYYDKMIKEEIRLDSLPTYKEIRKIYNEIINCCGNEVPLELNKEIKRLEEIGFRTNITSKTFSMEIREK